VEIRPTTLPDVENFDMRKEDKDEIIGLTGLDPFEALRQSILVSEDCWTVLDNGKVLCIAGCNKVDDGGCMWILFGDIQSIPLSFFKESRKYLKYLLDKYKMLSNYTAANNDFIIKWAKSLGFTVDDPIPYGPKGELFCKFHKEV
jgi:hypothetical protein